MDKCQVCGFGSELGELHFQSTWTAVNNYVVTLHVHPICVELRQALEDWQYDNK